MTDKQIEEFIYADGTTEEENFESFINSFDDTDEVYYRGKHYIKIMKNKLLRKEQECEELKIYIESNEQQVKDVETLVMDNDRLINELDQLKTENKHLNDLLNQALKDYEKARETLTEIKEIAEKDCKLCFQIDGFTKPDDCGICDYKQILQKISEVEDE